MSKINQGTVRFNNLGEQKPPPPIQIHRLTLAQYRELEKAVGPIDPRVNDPVQAGFHLGVQHVLAKVRSGFTAG